MLKKLRFALILAIAVSLITIPVSAFADDFTGDAGNPALIRPAAGTLNVTRSAEDAPATGWVRKGGKLYYYTSDGKLYSGKGWATIDGAKYYCLGSGIFATSPTQIPTKVTVSKKVKYKVKVRKKGKKKYKTKYKTVKTTENQKPFYMFGSDGKLITKSGVFTYDGKEYFGAGKGMLKTGWVASGNTAMYFDKKTCAMAKDTTVGYLKIPANGRLGKAYALGIKKLNSTKWTLRQAYKNSYKLKYRNRGFRRKTSEAYAIRGFTTGTGNCYVMAATFYIQAKLLGYDVHQVKGKVARRYPHSWTVIKQNGKEWVYDPNFKNETGRNGWKIYYGKKGTWKYTNKKKMN